MTFTKIISLLVFITALFSCSQPARQVKTQVDWNEELLGFGNLSAQLDSMGKQVMFVPKIDAYHYNSYFERFFVDELKVDKNTLKFHAALALQDIGDLFTKIHKDSTECQYLPAKLWTNLYLFLKVDGMRFLPDVLFYRPLSAALDQRFEYLFAVMRYDRRNVAFIEVLNSGLTLLYHAYLIDDAPHVLLLLKSEDRFVVRQLLQHTINTRMDTVLLGNYCGDGVPWQQQYLVYDEAIYDYNDLSKLDMLGHWLFMYFESHPDWQKVSDSLQIVTLTEKKPKAYSHYPVVIKAPEVGVLPPPLPFPGDF